MTPESTVGVERIPVAVRRLSSLTRIDHADQVSVPITQDPSTADATIGEAEQWARTMLGDVPNGPERLIWHGILRLELADGRSAETVAGWRLADGDQDWVRLEGYSPLLTANIIVRIADEQVSLTTLINFTGRSGRLIWALLLPLHRRITPTMISSAADRVRSSAPSSPATTGDPASRRGSAA